MSGAHLHCVASKTATTSTWGSPKGIDRPESSPAPDDAQTLLNNLLSAGDVD